MRTGMREIPNAYGAPPARVERQLINRNSNKKKIFFLGCRSDQ